MESSGSCWLKLEETKNSVWKAPKLCGQCTKEKSLCQQRNDVTCCLERSKSDEKVSRSYRFPFFCFFSKVIQQHAQQGRGNYNITQHVHKGCQQRQWSSPHFLFLCFLSLSLIPTPLLRLTVFGQMCRFFGVKNVISQVISCVCYFYQTSVTLCLTYECVWLYVCVWHMADTLSRDPGWHSNPLPLTKLSKTGSRERFR